MSDELRAMLPNVQRHRTGLTQKTWADIDAKVNAIFKSRAPVTSWLLQNGPLWDPNPQDKEAARMTLETQEITDKEVISPVTGLPIPIISTYHLPLPFVHHDAADVDGIEISARRVGEKVEETVLGIGEKFEGVLGLLNVPGCLRCGGSVENGIKRLHSKAFYGPHIVVSCLEEGLTTKHEALEGVQKCIGSPYLKKGQWILFQCTPDVICLLVGLLPTTIRWKDEFKTLCILVPQVRQDFYGNAGVAANVPK